MDPINNPVTFFTYVHSTGQRAQTRLLIESIHAFGGSMNQSPFWVFSSDPEKVPCDELKSEGVRIIPLDVPDTMRRNYFGIKVFSCAQAEKMASSDTHSLVWLASGYLVIQPPLLFDLDQEVICAARPVHIQNVGILQTDPLDGFWKKIYENVGVDDVPVSVETFVGAKRIRAYYNSHALAVQPSKGLFQQWLAHFETLVLDEAFQSGPCRDEDHQVFLHQAVLSALLSTRLDARQLRLLPPVYNYPYNLQTEVHEEHRAAALNDLVSIAYEARSLDPNLVEDIEIHEPLRSWLSSHLPAA